MNCAYAWPHECLAKDAPACASTPVVLTGVSVAARRLRVLAGAVAQVSTNVEDHRAVPLARLLDAVERHAPVAEAELVGVPPAAAFAGWPDRVPVRNRRTLEDAGIR